MFTGAHGDIQTNLFSYSRKVAGINFNYLVLDFVVAMQVHRAGKWCRRGLCGSRSSLRNQIRGYVGG